MLDGEKKMKLFDVGDNRMTEALINVGKAILLLLGIAVSLSLIAWIVAIITYIIYVIKER